jgi:signal transduction histidine kinase
MSNRVSALLSILGSPFRILGIVLTLIFTVEVCVMFLLSYLMPSFLSEFGKAIFDAALLTVVCAPILWSVIIGPLRRIAVQEHDRSETIVANASEGIVTFNNDGIILSCNRALPRLLKTDIDSLVGKKIDCFLIDCPDFFESSSNTYRLAAISVDGNRFPVEVSVSVYPSELQSLRIAIIRDLTLAERAEAERLLMARETEALRAQQMTTLAQLATGVAHEIRNPLTSIKLLIQVNRSRFAAEGLPTDDLELVEQEIRRMERSVNSLLDYARPEQGERSRFLIESVIGKACQLVDGRCVQQGVKICLDCDRHPMFIEGDASQIQQLLLNLMLNALDAMPDGGDLTVRSYISGNRLELSVIDSGKGIRDDMMEKLFVPFSTSKPRGVGLGLGICRRIAVSHGGTLAGRNLVEGGAEFRLTIPLSISESHQDKDLQQSEESCKVC